MIYLLYGTKNHLIQNEIKKISKTFENINISKFDLDSENIENIINDCMTLPLFSEKKLVICENANMFTASTSKDSEIIEQYLNNPNPDTTLIFTINQEKIDERKKITKLIKKNGTVKEFNENISPVQIIKTGLKDYQIDNSLINLFIERVGDNSLILENEIEKLKLYKEDQIITKEDILNVTTKKIDTDIFKLLDHIVKNNKSEALEIYHEMIKMNEEPIKIIIMLANQFRIMYQSKELLKKGLSEKDIASTLKIHPYRIKLAIQNGKKYSSDLLLQYLSDLADIDINIKTGKTDKNLALELFILKK